MQRIIGRPVAAALLALAAASPAVGARLEVTLAPRPGLVSDAEIRVGARRVGPSLPAVESGASIETTGRLGEHATLDLAPGTWELTAQAPGVWAAPEVVHVDGDASVALRLHQAGAVTGAVRTQGWGRPPERLRLLIQAAPGERSLGSVAVGSDCPVREGGAFRCEVPVGTLDLRLQAPGSITRYRWGAAVTAARPFEWGEALLEPGASLVGWAVVSGDTPLGERATAELYPAGLARGAMLAELTQRQEAVVLRAGINDRGFFHFDGLPPGDYLLVARQAPYAPAEAWVRVLAGVEAQLNQPLVLSPPAELRVFIDPPTGPAGETWSVELFKGSPGGNLTRAGRATAAADGSAL